MRNKEKAKKEVRKNQDRDGISSERKVKKNIAILTDRAVQGVLMLCK